MISPFQSFILGLFLILVQAAAAIPWMAVLNIDLIRACRRERSFAPLAKMVGIGLLGVLVLSALAAFVVLRFPVRESLEWYGAIYAVILQIQLFIDLFVVVFAILLAIWPKGAAVALSAFREGWRQPMFWLLVIFALVLMLLSPFIPYFTFGEDFKVVKELGYDTIMLGAVVFGVLAASMSISEEIEGRTAITLMSKPVSRRQFLIGKFVGILLASLMMTCLLTCVFDGILLFKPWYDKDPISIPGRVELWTNDWKATWGEVPAYFARGAAFWAVHVLSAMPGIILGFCQVMVLLAISVALATRLPMIVNLVICLVIFFLGHLAPVLDQVSQNKFALVRFTAQLFDTLLPGLDLFSLGAVLARDVPPPSGPFSLYIGMVSLYALMYTTIALLFGLILFEDRDLA